MILSIKYMSVITAFVFYFCYTLSYTLKFRKNKIYKGRIRVFHYLMFWLVPFVWVWLIKQLSKSAEGSHKTENKADPISFGGHYNA
jgi:hypothetical protein